MTIRVFDAQTATQDADEHDNIKDAINSIIADKQELHVDESIEIHFKNDNFNDEVFIITNS